MTSTAWVLWLQSHRLFRAPDGTIRLLVQGLKRIRIEEFTSEEPYLNAAISETTGVCRERT